MAMLVCRRWREVGEDCRLWNKFRIVIKKENIETVPKILNCRRLRMVRDIEVRKMSDKILESVLRLRGLHTLRIVGCYLTTQQTNAIFTYILLIYILK